MENKRVPELRFKGFNDDWELCKLGDVSEALEYGLNAPSKNFDGTHKYIRITDIDDTSHKFKQDGLTSPDIDIEILEYYKVQEGDILFARTGASVGKSYHYSLEDGLVYYAGFLIKARIKNEFSSEFIFQNTLTSNYDNFIKITSQRSGQPGINANEYSNYKIMIPKYNEQQKIGEFFYQFDNAIELHQRKINLLLDVKVDYLHSLFPNHDSNVPRLRFNNFNSEWILCKFSKILKTHPFRPFIATPMENGKYEIIQQGDNPIVGFSNGIPFKDFDNVTLFGDHTVSLFKPTKPFFIATDGIKIISAEGFNGNYLFATLTRYKPNSQGYKRHFTILKNTDIFFTNQIGEQEKIGKILTILDTLITLHKNKLDKFNQLKEAYLQKMFI